MGIVLDLIGQKFGKLTVIAFSHSENNQKYWECICDCGKKVLQYSARLRSNGAKSCGCLKMESLLKRSIKHGQSCDGKFTPEYRAWQNMNTRCYNIKNDRYDDYGGRGIIVCERWRTFIYFFEDMGKKPSPKHTLDRIDNDGNYELSNCRWATQKQQSQNRRSSRLIEYNGIIKPLIEWTRYLGLSDSGILSWYIKKHGVEKAMLHYTNSSKK